MAHKLADLRAKQDALKAEANGLLDQAEKVSGGQPTAEQEARLSAIKAELAAIDKEMDAEIGKLPAEAISTETAENVGGAAEADAVKAERQRAADILAACTLAGKVDKAAAFLASDKSVSQVVQELTAERAAASSATITTANAGGNTVADKDPWAKAIAKTNSRVAA